jgi:hypothetical protein
MSAEGTEPGGAFPQYSRDLKANDPIKLKNSYENNAHNNAEHC